MIELNLITRKEALMDRHPLSVERRFLPFKAIDGPDAILREDALAFREMEYGYDLLIACILLPHQLAHSRLLKEALLSAIERQTSKWYGAINFCKDNSIGGAGKTIEKGFVTSKARPAVVARYAVSKTDGVFSIDLSVGRVRLQHAYTHSEYVRGNDMHNDSERIKSILDELQIYDNEKDDAKNLSSGDVVKGGSHLFNGACQRTALSHDIPFIGIVGSNERKHLTFSPVRGIFNRPVRDPIGFINLMNLSSIFLGTDVPFPKQYLLQEFPDLFHVHS